MAVTSFLEVESVLAGETYLFVKLDEGWLELLLNVFTKVVWELVVRIGLACIVLVLWCKIEWLSWNFVEWNFSVLGIADLVKFNMGYLLVADDGWVVVNDVAWKLWECGSHAVILLMILLKSVFLLSLMKYRGMKS